MGGGERVMDDGRWTMDHGVQSSRLRVVLGVHRSCTRVLCVIRSFYGVLDGNSYDGSIVMLGALLYN